MTQRVPPWPAISIANFGNDFAGFCKSCKGRLQLYRFRSYRSVTKIRRSTGDLPGRLSG
jgi:hypothetical protein